MTDPAQTSSETENNPEAEAKFSERAEKAEANFFQKTWTNTSEMYNSLVNNPNVRAGVLTMLELFPIGVGAYSLADVAVGFDATQNIREALTVWKKHTLSERLQYGAKGVLQVASALIPVIPITGIADRVIQEVLPIKR